MAKDYDHLFKLLIIGDSGMCNWLNFRNKILHILFKNIFKMAATDNSSGLHRSEPRIRLNRDCIGLRRTEIRCRLLYIATILLIIVVVILFIDGFAGGPAGGRTGWRAGRRGTAG